MAAARRGSMFQSLGRDSGCSSLNRIMDGNVSLIVSIPRSGFWVFKQRREEATAAPPRGFNPSVGILGVQAMIMVGLLSVVRRFQSLGRDSGCSSEYSAHPATSLLSVSIPRSGFWVFKQTAGASTPTASSRFNPSVGILGVQASQTGVHPPLRIRFNPSVGILGVQASRKPPSATERAGFNPSVGILGVQAAVMMSRQAGKNEFQSLGRDSGCSSRDKGD